MYIWSIVPVKHDVLREKMGGKRALLMPARMSADYHESHITIRCDPS